MTCYNTKKIFDSNITAKLASWTLKLKGSKIKSTKKKAKYFRTDIERKSN